MSPNPAPLSRRTLLKSTAGIAAGSFAIGTAGACSNQGRGGAAGSENLNASVTMPTYVRYDAVKPDLRGTGGVLDGYYHYPTQPTQAVSAKPGDGRPVSILTMTNAPIAPTMDRNLFWQAFNKELASEAAFTTVPAADYGQRFATSLAGDNLADIFCINNLALDQLPQLLSEKAADLTEHLSGDAIKKYPMLANIPTESWRYCVYGGKIRAVPVPRGILWTSLLYGRTELLAKKGITQAPTSWADLMDLATEVSAPKQNTWAFGGVPIDMIRQMWGVPNQWALVDGKLQSSYEAEQQLDALDAARKMFAAGVVNPAAFENVNQQYQQWFIAGRSLLQYDTFSAWGALQSQLTAAGGQLLSGYAPPNHTGTGRAGIWKGRPTAAISAVSAKAADRVETMLNILNWWSAPFGTQEYLFRKYGVKGIHYNFTATGDPVRTDRGISEIELGQNYIVDAPFVTYDPQSTKSTKNQYEAQTAFSSATVENPVAGLYSATLSRKGAAISKPLDDLQIAIIQGRQAVSSWTDAVKTWRTAGGATIKTELQDALQHK